MEKEMQVRNYNMADASLIVVAGEKQRFMVRDLAEFTLYNVLAPEMTTFKADITAFEALPTDIELEGLKIETTSIKDVIADNMKVAIREIMTRAKNKYGEAHGKYKQFGTLGMDTFDDPHLLVCGRRVARTATTYINDLGTKGLTVAMVTALTTLVNAFENAILNQSDAIANRDNATDDRIEMGNLLYKKLVDYCETGKTIWVTKDEAKYNDYIIYDTPSGLAPEAAPVV
jgi:hypothetical protein